MECTLPAEYIILRLLLQNKTLQYPAGFNLQAKHVAIIDTDQNGGFSCHMTRELF
jgi:hypothetical protein